MQEKQKHKIAFFTNSMGIGGAERVISRLIPGLSEMFDIYLILLDGSKMEYDLNVKTISFFNGEKKNRILYLIDIVKASVKLKKYVKNENIECVVSFLSIPNIINILCCKSAKRIISIRGQLGADNNKGVFSRIKNALEKVIYKKADKIIVPSKMLKKDVQELCGIIDGNQVCVIYNPIEKSEILRLSEETVADEYEIIFKKKQVIIALGRMTREKGYEHLLKSFKLLVNDMSEVCLMIIGDGCLLEDMKGYAIKLGIADRVVFTGNMKNPFPYLKRANLYVLSSISEGFPNALVEAMACGLPVVSTDCKSGPREILSCKEVFDISTKTIEYSDFGVLSPRFEENVGHKEFAEAMKHMLVDIDIIEKYRKLSEERTNYFDIDRIVKSYEEEIISVIG